jgi:hypothetical protein
VRRLPSTLIIAALTLVGLELGTALPVTAAPTTSAPKLLAAALKAAQTSGSAHFVETAISGKQSQKIVGDVSASSASQTVSGAGSGLQAQLIGSAIYINGGAVSLESALQLTAAQATPNANKWIAISSTDAPFSGLSQALSLAATLSSFTPKAKGLHLGSTTSVGGVKVIPISGTPASLSKGTTGTVTLYVSAKAPYLPVKGSVALANKSQHFSESVVFSNWGGKVTLTAPVSTVPYSSISGG